MNRILKTLGLAAFAAMAMSAMFAASASAVNLKSGITKTPTNEITATAVHATQYGPITNNVFTAFGEELHCTNHSNTFTGNVDNGSDPSVTITPIYRDCFVVGSNNHNIVRPVTVTMNGCTFTFTTPHAVAGTTTTFTGTVDLVCPTPQTRVEIHAYFAQSMHTGNHSFTVCTETLAPQPEISKVEYHNVKDPITGRDDITVTVRGAGIKATKHGLCGAGETKTAEYHSDLTLTSNTHDIWF